MDGDVDANMVTIADMAANMADDMALVTTCLLMWTMMCLLTWTLTLRS